MDRARARASFDAYVAAYDATNPRIALKIEHTLHVTALCERIARGLGLPEPDIDLAWMAGLLHDIGRFEQVRRFDTFNDARSVSHASLGIEVLFDTDPLTNEPLIRRFVENPANDEPLRTAIATHSDYRLPQGLDSQTRTLCTILRDADKIDILRVNCECPIEDIYGVSEQAMRGSEVSDACVDIFYQHRCLPRGVREHPADIMLGHICFAWELVHPQSIELVREQGHLEHMLSRTWQLPATQQAFDAMARHIRKELGI